VPDRVRVGYDELAIGLAERDDLVFARPRLRHQSQRASLDGGQIGDSDAEMLADDTRDV
jgi:hypothetical protein